MKLREDKHVAPDGQPYDNSMCFYNRDEIDKWIERQPAAIICLNTSASITEGNADD
ncbi:excisionase family protein [Yersinia aleksiciae]|uniref:excisionase family protein n=1 Tax=Yersinia aleksiciae TaxID=263819 RepID=UPI0036F21DE1